MYPESTFNWSMKQKKIHHPPQHYHTFTNSLWVKFSLNLVMLGYISTRCYMPSELSCWNPNSYCHGILPGYNKMSLWNGLTKSHRMQNGLLSKIALCFLCYNYS